MKIITLLENESSVKKIKKAHGFSLYIEVQNKKYLFDLGPNKDFVKNAEMLGVDLKEVDALIISHGHYDHATKLKFFMKYNKNADVYISKNAFNKHVAKVGKIVKDIGIGTMPESNRLTFVDGDIQISKEVLLTSNVEYEEHPLSDERLYVKKGNKYIKDFFDHELYMIINVNDKKILITGCAHKGIDNIIKTLEERLGYNFNYVIGGFHFKRFKPEDDLHVTYLANLRNKFSKKSTKYYACHCTGKTAFDFMNEEMNNIYSLHGGDVLEVE